MEGRDQSITGTAAYSVPEGVTPMLYEFCFGKLVYI